MKWDSDFASVLAFTAPLTLVMAIVTAMLLFEWAMDWLNGPDDPDGYA